MFDHNSSSGTLAKTGGWLLIHLFAIVMGVVLMIAGIAMGVTVVLLPLGVPAGFAGLAMFIWGLFAQSEESRIAGQGPVG